ncbi:LysR family transcriptional regulator [Mycolicibacterium hodleri]|uniref:Probable hydrogen peroxide-inducible genes activator n=1 Tax=Mycolicibacterium hodleri TaxID=49897 RepID=A0A502EFG4_9MYCO|nr:LysR family transcriptional regulator [Mycolicibacterium hodleri]TPG36418.1 LysR family transcriptional regulator [Mycolicibacterium hodleri]
MELRQLEAFVAVATELHFGRAAQRLHMGQPTLSELVRRLEREIGTPLLTRTTRRVALTGAGVELLGRAKVILDDVAAAKAAARRVAHGDAGTVRLGITPPVAPVLAPHLRDALESKASEVELRMARMWLPDLARAVADGTIDVAITCGLVTDPPGVVSEVFCGEPLFVGLRSDHRLADRDTVALTDLARDRLGIPSDALFPAWALAQRQALDAAGVSPTTVVLDATDLSGTSWPAQRDVDWILMIASLTGAPAGTTVRPVAPAHLVPYTLQWNPDRAQTAAVARFVHLALTVDPPPGWLTQPGHLRHDVPAHFAASTRRRPPSED